MKYQVGFIGCGNMASAIIGGLINQYGMAPNEIIAADVSKAAVDNAKEQLKISVTGDNLEVVKNSEVIFLSVKPQYYEDVISKIKDSISKEQLIITIAPGKTLEWLMERLGSDKKIVRTMPNTPALVGEGITGVCKNVNVTDEDFDKASKVNSNTQLYKQAGNSIVVNVLVEIIKQLLDVENKKTIA